MKRTMADRYLQNGMTAFDLVKESMSGGRADLIPIETAKHDECQSLCLSVCLPICTVVGDDVR